MSVIENALGKLRRAAGYPGSGTGPSTLRPEAHGAAESRYVHRQIAIDPLRLRADGYLPDPDQERRFADYFHRVKRPIIQAAMNGADEMRLILLSSALPGEGKTFATLNLAFSMARERDLSVLLVDADLPRAHISHVLDLHRGTGLLDALYDPSRDVESLVMASNVPGLQILPAGGPTGATADGVSELLSSARMREIASRLSRGDPRRLVLFDSPPLLVSSEARALAQIPGQIVLVVRVGQTPRQALLDAIAQVDRKKLQGLVLNDAQLASELGYYGYPTYGSTRDATASGS